MDRPELKLETLHELDPIAARAVDEAIAQAVYDCQNRPRVGKPRKVSLTLVLTPQESADGSEMVDSIDAYIEPGYAKLPPRRSSGHVLGCTIRGTKQGVATFNPADTQSHPSQMTLDEAGEDAGDKDGNE